MYHAIVRGRVKRLFDEANRGNWRAIVDGLDDQFTYRFAGDTPLGGERRTKATPNNNRYECPIRLGLKV